MSKVKILAFILKVYKPIAAWAVATFATKTALSQNEANHLHPVDIDSLTPSSTFRENSVIGINGVLYRSLRQTSNLPVTPQIQNGSFVIHIVNGKKALVIADYTLDEDWEVFTDAAIEYWIASINASLSSKQDTISDIATIRSKATSALQPTNTYTYNGMSYTVDAMLTELVKFMSKTIVTKN